MGVGGGVGVATFTGGTGDLGGVTVSSIAFETCSLGLGSGGARETNFTIGLVGLAGGNRFFSTTEKHNS